MAPGDPPGREAHAGDRLRARFAGTVFRQTALHVPDCLPPRTAAPHAGRYHRPGDPWPLYASLDRATMWSEWRHATGGAVAPADDPRWICELSVDLELLDLRDPAVRRALGVDLAALRGPWSATRANPACLAVLAAARRLGADGAIVPSAARGDGWNVAILPRAFERVTVGRRRRATAPSRPSKQ